MLLRGSAKRGTKHAVATLARGAARSPLIRLLPYLAGSQSDRLSVLTYHRVDRVNARPDLCGSTLSATPSDFAAQMKRLREHFHVVTISEVRQAFAMGRPLPRRAVLITFDDAYRDFVEHAWPVLRRLELAATMFVPTAFVYDENRVFWWDRLHQIVTHAPQGSTIDSSLGIIRFGNLDQRGELKVRLARQLARGSHPEMIEELDRIAKQLGVPAPPPAVLGWDELRRLTQEGLDVAPHTRTHPLMNRIPLEQARDEVTACRAELQQQLGRVPPVFAYPGGAYDEPLVHMLADEGFELAFTTCRGANDLRRCDPLRLRRINLGRNTTPELLTAQLHLPPSVFNRWWSLPA